MTHQISETFLRTMADAVPGLIAHWDLELRCSFANRRYSQWFGLSLDQVVGATMPEVLGQRLFALARPHVDAVLAGVDQRFDRVVTKADGTVVHAWVNYVPHRDDAGAVRGFFVLVTDVTPLWQSEQRALESERRYRALAEHSGDMIFHLDRDFVRRYASPACREILGYEPQELVGLRPISQVHPEDAPRVAAVFQALVDGSIERGSVTNRIAHKAGHWVWVEVEFRAVRDPLSGRPSGIIGAMRDVSLRKSAEAQLARATQHLAHLARRDGLTGLANRRHFDERLAEHGRERSDAARSLSLIMLDVDWFKPFNDSYGHPEGDACLRRVGETITAAIRRPQDVAARYGGEEFAILLPDTDEGDAALVAERIRDDVERLALEHRASPCGIVTVSAGVAATGRDRRGPGWENALLREADRALYAAKNRGRNAVCRSSRPTTRDETLPGPSRDKAARRTGVAKVA